MTAPATTRLRRTTLRTARPDRTARLAFRHSPHYQGRGTLPRPFRLRNLLSPRPSPKRRRPTAAAPLPSPPPSAAAQARAPPSHPPRSPRPQAKPESRGLLVPRAAARTRRAHLRHGPQSRPPHACRGRQWIPARRCAWPGRPPRRRPDLASPQPSHRASVSATRCPLAARAGVGAHRPLPASSRTQRSGDAGSASREPMGHAPKRNRNRRGSPIPALRPG